MSAGSTTIGTIHPQLVGWRNWLWQRRWVSGAAAVALTVFVTVLWIDFPVARWAESLHGTLLRAVFAKLSILGQSEWYLVPPVLIIPAAYRRWPEMARWSLHMFTAVAGTGIAVNVLKTFIGRPRPKLYLLEHSVTPQGFSLASDYLSMPSGHATTFGAVTCVLALAYPRYRMAILAIGAALMAGRVVTAHHYVSDVIAGGVLGAVGAYLAWRPCMGWRAGA